MLPTNNKNRTSHFVALTFALIAAGPGEAIRNNGDPICSDSFDLDSNVQQVMIAANPFVARQVDKGVKSAART